MGSNKKNGAIADPILTLFCSLFLKALGNRNISGNGMAFSSIIRNREFDLVISGLYVSVAGMLLRAGIAVAKLPKP